MNDRNRRRELARKHAAKSKANKALESISPTVGEGDLPGWVHEGLRSVEENTSPGSLPVFVVLREGAPKSEAVAVMRLSELARHFNVGPAGESKDEGEKA